MSNDQNCKGVPQLLASIPEHYLAQMKRHPMHPTLAQRLAEMRNAMGDMRVLKVESDHLILLALEGDPDPFLLVLRLDGLVHQFH